jgi:ribonuclease P protein component
MIGKKFARTAVLRNALKRRLREQFRLRQTELPPLQYVARLNGPVSAKDVANVLSEWTALDRDIRRDIQREATLRAPVAVRGPQ